MKLLTRIYAVLILLVLAGLAAAQDVSILDPAGWLASPEAVMAAGALVAGYIVNLLTAIGKDWFQTDGPRTRYLAVAISSLIAGVGGYASLGYLSDLSGWQGAIRAAIMVAVAAVVAIGKAHADRQASASGAVRALGK